MKTKNMRRILTGALGVAVVTASSTMMMAGTVLAADTSTQSKPADMPSGDAPSGDAPSGDAPSGDAPSGGPDGAGSGASGEAPAGNPPTDGAGEGGSGGPGGSGAPGGGSSAVTEWEAATTITGDTTEDSKTYDSTGTDENAILVSNGATAILNSPTITRTSASSTGGDNASFYGVGAAVLTTDGTTIINGGTVTTDAAGGAGIFSYDKGVTYVSGTTVNTTQDTSGGIHVAGGGTLYAWNMDATTNGESAAAIRSDRGGGTMVVDGGTYTSNGVGSPAVYCTADISINNSTLIANGSEGVCIEGLNTLRLFNSDLTSNMSDDDQNDSTWSVILYQSMSGDSEVGNSVFDMVGGTLTSENGGLFYTTNTECDILLDDVTIKAADDSEYFLRVSGNDNQRGWGTSGANGSQCNFTGISQEMDGDVIWDSISELDFYMTEGSTLIGSVTDDESYAGDGGDGYCNMYIDADSTWTVTGDSEVTSLESEGTITDTDGNTVSVVGTDGTVYVEGTSDYTVTVEDYSDTCDLSGIQSAPSWDDYEVEVPDGLIVDTASVSTTENDASSTTLTADEITQATDTTESDSSKSYTFTILAIVAAAAIATITGVVLSIRKKK